jgi:hypothetical protein
MAKKLSRHVRYDVYRGDRMTILVRLRNESSLDHDLPNSTVYCVRLQTKDCCLSRRHYVCHSTLFRLFERYGMTMATSESEEILEEPEEYGYVQ